MNPDSALGAGLAGFVEWGFYLMGLAWLLTFAGIGAVPGRGGS